MYLLGGKDLKNILKTIINCLSALFIMTLINGLSPLIGIIPFIGMKDLGYTLSNLLILALTFLFVYSCITKGIRDNLSTYRITKPYFKKEWFFFRYYCSYNYVLGLFYYN